MRINRTGMLIAAGVGLVAVLWLFDVFRSNEGGIRVKNGTVTFETLSGSGFKRAGRGFKSKLKTRECFQIIVTGGDCGPSGPRSVDGARTFRFYRGAVSQDGENTRDFPAGPHRFHLRDGEGWTLSDTDADRDLYLRYADQILTRISATGANGTVLNCTNADAAATFYGDATPMDCP
jgi:hypothetical protein